MSMPERLETFFHKLQDDLSALSSCSDSKEFAFSRLNSRMRKRAEVKDPLLKEKALTDFIELNRSLESVKVCLDPRIEHQAKHFIAVVLERFVSTFDEMAFQEPLSMEFIFDNWRFGPGASNGIKGTHPAYKILQKMTCTDRSESVVLMLRRRNPYFSCFDAANGGGTAIVHGSRLETVQKNEDTMRTIAIEPSGNMALQLAAGYHIEGALRYIGLDISKQQPINKAYANRGSIDGSLATIDMKSASDMITPDLVFRLFPSQWFKFLMRIRSPDRKSVV